MSHGIRGTFVGPVTVVPGSIVRVSGCIRQSTRRTVVFQSSKLARVQTDPDLLGLVFVSPLFSLNELEHIAIIITARLVTHEFSTH